MILSRTPACVALCSPWFRRLPALALAAAMPFGVARAEAAPASMLAPSWRLDFEAQRFALGANRLQRPNTFEGTRFSAEDYTGEQGTGGRLGLWGPINVFGRHGTLGIVLAPLQQSGSRVADQPVRFDGVTFQAGLPLHVLYRFNTYRITYHEILAEGLTGDWTLYMGGTLAIRDARISLSQASSGGDSRRQASVSNVGPVPLWYGAAVRPLGGRWQFDTEIYAFPAPGGGGLFDGSVKLQWSIDAGTALYAGARYQAGGAVDREIYNVLRQRAVIVGLSIGL